MEKKQEKHRFLSYRLGPTLSLGWWDAIWGRWEVSPTFESNLQEEKQYSISRYDFGLTSLDPTAFRCHQHQHPTSTLISRDASAAKQVIPLKHLAREGSLRSQLRNPDGFSASRMLFRRCWWSFSPGLGVQPVVEETWPPAWGGTWVMCSCCSVQST